VENPQSDQEKAARPATDPVEPARKLRMALLLCALAAVVAVAGLRAAARKRRAAAIRHAVSSLRQALGQLRPGAEDLKVRFQTASDLAERIRALDPDNVEAQKLSVALYYAWGRVDLALAQFNRLEPDSLAAQVPESELRRAWAALAPFGTPREEFSKTEIHGDVAEYVKERGMLWNVARRAAGAEGGQTQKALKLCRWFALHTVPMAADAPPADPATVLLSGSGTPRQLAWAYSELARQACVRCRVVAPPPGDGPLPCLVQVEPAGMEPFLVDPAAGVPLLDAASGKQVSLASLKERPDACPPYPGAKLAAAPLRLAVHPYAFLPRVMAFDRMLSDLPARPAVAFQGGGAPSDGQLRLWAVPFRLLAERQNPARAKALAEAMQPLGFIGVPRSLQLNGLARAAAVAYEKAHEELSRKLAESDLDEAKRTLSKALELASFFEAESAFEAASDEEAASQLRSFLKRFPDSDRAVPARLMLAELLACGGKPEEAREIWQGLPPQRKLYGQMRLRESAGRAPAEDRSCRPATPSEAQ